MREWQDCGETGEEVVLESQKRRGILGRRALIGFTVIRLGGKGDEYISILFTSFKGKDRNLVLLIFSKFTLHFFSTGRVLAFHVGPEGMSLLLARCL